jgi:hypothetical protein
VREQRTVFKLASVGGFGRDRGLRRAFATVVVLRTHLATRALPVGAGAPSVAGRWPVAVAHLRRTLIVLFTRDAAYGPLAAVHFFFAPAIGTALHAAVVSIVAILAPHFPAVAIFARAAVHLLGPAALLARATAHSFGPAGTRPALVHAFHPAALRPGAVTGRRGRGHHAGPALHLSAAGPHFARSARHSRTAFHSGTALHALHPGHPWPADAWAAHPRTAAHLAARAAHRTGATWHPTGTGAAHLFAAARGTPLAHRLLVPTHRPLWTKPRTVHPALTAHARTGHLPELAAALDAHLAFDTDDAFALFGLVVVGTPLHHRSE